MYVHCKEGVCTDNGREQVVICIEMWELVVSAGGNPKEGATVLKRVRVRVRHREPQRGSRERERETERER